MNLGTLVRRAALQFKDAPCLVEGGRTLSFAEFDSATDRLANALRAQGLETGDRVSVLLPNSIDCLIAYYAIAKAGLVRLALNPLNKMQYKQMKKMQQLQPELTKLKEKYKEDKVKQQQEMMALWRRHGVNPMGGCLPMLVQIPFFIALYWVLLESVELRQAPWALWIDDLSARDPYFILPLLMGVTMFVQQKLNPAPPDPVTLVSLLKHPLCAAGQGGRGAHLDQVEKLELKVLRDGGPVVTPQVKIWVPLSVTPVM